MLLNLAEHQHPGRWCGRCRRGRKRRRRRAQGTLRRHPSAVPPVDGSAKTFARYAGLEPDADFGAFARGDRVPHFGLADSACGLRGRERIRRSGWTCTESLSSGKMNFTSSGMRRLTAEAGSRPFRGQSGPGSGQRAPRKGSVAKRHCSPVSQTSPMRFSARLTFGKKRSEARAPQMRGTKMGARRAGASSRFTWRRGGSEEALETPQAFLDALHGCGVGKSQEAGSAEGIAGNDGDVRAFEQLLGKHRGVVRRAVRSDAPKHPGRRRTPRRVRGR